MTTDQQLDEHGIEQYRHALTAEAELARGDLDEIEDHLRALATELRGGGLDAVAAVAEAARRLGDPRAVAREHARVRTTFGATLPRWRAWGAAALMLPFIVYYAVHYARFGLHDAAVAALVVGLAMRWTWARALLFGMLATGLLLMPLSFAAGLAPGMQWLNMVAVAGAVALIAPWRKVELSPAGWALAMIPPAWAAATTLTYWQMTASDGHVIALGSPIIAMWALGLAFAGIVLRARWAAACTLIVALMLGLAGAAVLTLTPRFPMPTLWRAMQLAQLALAELGMLAGTLIMWRAARSNLGTLRGLSA